MHIHRSRTSQRGRQDRRAWACVCVWPLFRDRFYILCGKTILNKIMIAAEYFDILYDVPAWIFNFVCRSGRQLAGVSSLCQWVFMVSCMSMSDSPGQPRLRREPLRGSLWTMQVKNCSSLSATLDPTAATKFNSEHFNWLLIIPTRWITILITLDLVCDLAVCGLQGVSWNVRPALPAGRCHAAEPGRGNQGHEQQDWVVGLPAEQS